MPHLALLRTNVCERETDRDRQRSLGINLAAVLQANPHALTQDKDYITHKY